MTSLYSAYLESLDGLLQLAIGNFHKIDNIQLIILGVEAVGMTVAVVAFMWFSLSQVRARYHE